MHAIGHVVAVFARILLRTEWLSLAPQLSALYEIYRLQLANRPCWALQVLLISGEDHRFFRHAGVDPIALCRAIWRGLVFRKREGASTIEMQLVRVLTGRYEKTFSRKLREIGLATLVEEVVPKSCLPALYALVGYYGWRMNGLQAACYRLRLDPQHMSLHEAANLISRLKYPEPRRSSSLRQMQIARRSCHLLALHNKHSVKTVYRGLSVSTAYATV